MTLYDIRSQEHAWLLSFLSVEKQTLTGGYEEKRNQKLASFFDQSEKSIVITLAEPRKQCCQVGCSKIRKTLENSPYIYKFVSFEI